VSFSKVNPPGWANGDELTLQQINQLDADHANSLDKSAAGDELLGTITFGSGAQINANTGAAIAATVAQGILIATARGLETSAAGGIVLGGGSTDEIGYSPDRSKLVTQLCMPLGGQLASGWTLNVQRLVGPGAAGVQALGPLPFHNGATLTNVRMYLAVASHSSLPAVMPDLQIHRMGPDGSNIVIGEAQASAASVTDWNAMPFWDVPCTEGGPGANVIDRTQYSYYALLADESGSGAVGGNLYAAMVLTFSAISDMRFE
jgi:hypothetical protein